jgi:hypothetical protein
MKLILSLVSLLCVCAFSSVAAEGQQGKIFHVVSFKFKDSVTEAQKQEVVDAFAALKKSVSQIKSLDYGTNISPEKLDKGFTHMWVLTFDNTEDRNAYLVHPEHKKFAGKLGGKLAEGGVFVVDFESKK